MKLRGAIAVLQECKIACASSKDPTSRERNRRSGAMIEIPSAAISANVLAREAPIFSVSNKRSDSVALAVDRVNEKIAASLRPDHPAVCVCSK